MTNALADRLALQGRFPSFLRKSEAIKIPNADAFGILCVASTFDADFQAYFQLAY